MQPTCASPRDLHQVYVGVLSSNCHKLRMSETSAIKRVLAPPQRRARTNGDAFPEDGSKIRTPAAPGAASPEREPPHSAPPHPDPPADETHAEAPASDVSQP